MTMEQYNSLPLEARSFIEAHAGCLGCGNAEHKLTRAYELYKRHRMGNVYQLKGGGINYVVDDRAGVLYNIKDEDSDFEKREKIAIAARLREAKPSIFLTYDEKAISELLASLDEEEIVVVTDEGIDGWIERSDFLGIDTKTASYEELKAFSEERNLEARGKKKVDYVEAINAIDTELM